MRNETAIFVDGPNAYATAKAHNIDIDYKLLMDFYTDTTDLVRAAYYTAVRERQPNENDPIRPLLDFLEYNGWTLVQKPTKEWASPDGGRPKIKGNMDIEIAVDAMEIAEHIRNAVFFTGDGDFKPLIIAMQRKGVRCTVVSTIRTQPPMCADELRRIADRYIDLEDLIKLTKQQRKAGRYE